MGHSPWHFDSFWHFPLLFFETSKPTIILARTFSCSPSIKHLAYSEKERHNSIRPLPSPADTHVPEKWLLLRGGAKGCSDPAPQAHPHAQAAGSAPTFHYHHCLNKGSPWNYLHLQQDRTTPEHPQDM